jgi:hypothetical protein
MASKPETRYRLRVENKLPSGIYHLKLALPYAGGVADSWYSSTDGDLWVEYKWIPKPPVRVDLDLVGGDDPWISKLQQDWLRDRHEEGRNVGVIVGTPKGGLIFPGREWESPVSPEHLEFVDIEEVVRWLVQAMQR